MLCFAAAAWICSCVLCPDDNVKHVCLHIHLLFEPPFFSLFFHPFLASAISLFPFLNPATLLSLPLTKYILFLFTVLIAHDLFIPLLLSFFHVPPLLLPTFLSHFPQFYPNFYFLCHSLSLLFPWPLLLFSMFFVVTGDPEQRRQKVCLFLSLT